MRRCTQCGNKKPIQAFASHKSEICKQCEKKTKDNRRPRRD